jgi:hypothetical protein
MFFNDDPTENPADGLSDAAKEILVGMAESGSAEGAGVACLLNGIALNSEEQAGDDHLLGCATEIRDWVQSFIDQLTRHSDNPPTNAALFL